VNQPSPAVASNPQVNWENPTPMFSPSLLAAAECVWPHKLSFPDKKNDPSHFCNRGRSLSQPPSGRRHCCPVQFSSGQVRCDAAQGYLVTTVSPATRKLYDRKNDRAMRFCCAILMQYRYDAATKARYSDVDKGAWQMPCRNYGLRPGLFLISPKFLRVSLGVGG